MRIHKREMPVRDATREIDAAISDIIKKHELTTAETLRVVNEVTSNWIGTIAKHSIRAERHPEDPDKPGGIE